MVVELKGMLTLPCVDMYLFPAYPWERKSNVLSVRGCNKRGIDVI